MIMSCPKLRGGLTNLTQTDEHLISISWFSGGALPGWQDDALLLAPNSPGN